MLKYISIAFLLLCAATAAHAQDTAPLTLQECVSYAQKNSLRIQQASISLQQNEIAERQAYWARYPSLSANVQHGFNLGRSVDLTTYQFVNQLMQATSLSIGANIPIYSGGQLRNSLQRSRLETQASQQDIAQAKLDLALTVTQAYLSVLLAEESLLLLKEQVKLTEDQLQRTLKLINSGSLAENARFDLDAQIARDEQSIATAENSVELAYLNLKIALNYPLQEPLRIQSIDSAAFTAATASAAAASSLNAESIYQEALQRQPNLQAARLRQSSAMLAVRIAEGALQPTIGAYLNWGSNYSSTGNYFTGDTLMVMQTLTGELNGAPFELNIPQAVPERESSGFFRQIRDNNRASMGISAQIPIFNGFQTRLRIEQARLSVRLNEMTTKQIQIQLQSDIQRAVLDLRGSEKRLAAAERSLKATQTAVGNTQKRFENGLVNAFEYTSTLTTLTAARSSLLQAQYDYLFRLKIVEFYQGKVF